MRLKQAKSHPAFPLMVINQKFYLTSLENSVLSHTIRSCINFPTPMTQMEGELKGPNLGLMTSTQFLLNHYTTISTNREMFKSNRQQHSYIQKVIQYYESSLDNKYEYLQHSDIWIMNVLCIELSLLVWKIPDQTYS